MAPAQGQKGEWMRMPICLIAYTYASHSEKQHSCKSGVLRFQNNQRRDVNCDPSFWCCRRHRLSGDVQCPLFCSQISVWVGTWTTRLSRVPSPTPSAGYLGKCHTTGIYHLHEPRLEQTSTLVQSQPHANKLPHEWPKWGQLYRIKAIITTWINISRCLLFPKVVNKPVICSQAWGFIRAWVEHSALGHSVGATDTS